MFKIESYITSIILSNADKYIKNFRKQDAQVSLWEGDATFHNIDLNVDALNEEFQLPFIFTSGYIHDLIIHVPWTKLMSEPVTISVNTIECVMRLKSKDEKIFCPQEKPSAPSTESKDSNDKRTPDETSNQSSYTSNLTSKIMNNLSIRCENVILKLVEEDIVFSMNIEKLTFDNVNENWIQTMTDVNLEKLLTRKLIALSGVTICLDKQNSSGRIDTYLEPLLYRCQIHIRLLRAYNRVFSKKPVYTRFDILSDKMSFTISEPQIPMLFKLAVLILYSNETPSSINSRNLSFNSDSISTKSDGSALCNENIEEGGDVSWGNWLWSMMPSVLSQEEDLSTMNNDVDVTCTFHVGFCVKILEANLKVLSHRVKKSSKIEFDHILKSTFNGCIYRMVMRNSEWFNVQFGVNYVCVETSSQDCNNLPQRNQFIRAGAETEYDFLKDTLFDEMSFHSNQHRRDDDFEEEQKDVTNFDFLYKANFTLQSHLNLYTEHLLLEKTQAFAIDYLKCYQPNKDLESDEISRYSDNESVEELTMEPKSNLSEKHILLRFVFGTSEIKINSDVIDSINYVHKIIPYHEFANINQSSGGVVESEHYYRNKYTPNYITQFTLFDLALELHPTLTHNQMNNSRTGPMHGEDSKMILPPAVLISCKCIDGKINVVRNTTFDNRVELKKITMCKAVEIGCFITKLGQRFSMLKCEKFDCDFTYDLCECWRELRVETRNLCLTSSKSNLLLASYIWNYIWSSFRRFDYKMDYFNKIFHSSVLEDSYIPSNVILEVFVGNVVIGYKSVKNTFNVNVSMDNCKAYAVQMKDHLQKRVIVFNTTESIAESSRLQVMIQRCENCNEECNLPSCIWFSFKNVKINLDVTLYSWIMYTPVPIILDHTLPKTNASLKEQAISKSAAGRKISDSNSGTHSRRYSTNFPKPKESVHSSSEHEALSPPIITDTETSDVFQLPPETLPSKRKTGLIEYLKDNIQLWRSLIVYGEISQITIYIPTNEFVSNNESSSMEYLIKESFKNSSTQDAKLNVFVFSLKSAKVKCDLPVNILEELSVEPLISFSKIGWNSDKLTFPWTISVSEMSVDTLLQNYVCKPLLKPLSANCTVGISIKSNAETQSTIAICVHSDFQPIVISLSDDQVNSITETINVLNNFRKNRRNVIISNELSKQLVPSPNHVENTAFDEMQNKCTGWIQCTFTKCSINLYSKCNSELRKLSTEFEDSIMSLEFDDTFHKMKLKIASFGIHHYKRKWKNDLWQSGSFHGVIIQRCYSQASNVDKKSDEESDDRFFLATVTRARSSNLKTRLQPCQTSSELLNCSGDGFVTEIILKICPTDIIIPLNVIESFLSLLIPIKKCVFISHHSTRKYEKESKQEVPIAKPLMYMDVPKIRIFIPLSKVVENELYNLNDTFVCEIGSIHLDCHPENPIIRKPLHSNLYYTLSGKPYANVEQKLQNQQYEVVISDISVNLGVWYEIQKMLEKEHLSVEEPPSAFEQNPAVMWNQGCHPESKHKINLRHLSPIVSKFSCKALLAPPVESFSLKSFTYSAHYEISFMSDVNVTISLNQIALLILLYEECANCAFPYFEVESDGRLNSKLIAANNGVKSKLTDSGIESMDQSSADSSSIFGNKSECRSGHVQSVNSKIFYSALSSTASGMNQRANFLTKRENVRQIYVTAQNINVIFYKTCEIQENGNKQIVYDPLMCAEIVQPYVFLNNENDITTTQLSIFNVCVKLPTMRSNNSYFACIPSVKDFPRALLYAMKTKCDTYSQIKYACLTIKNTIDTNKRRKNEVTLGQPVLVDCDLNAIKYILSSIESCLSEYKSSMEMFQHAVDKRDQSVQTCEKDIELENYKRYTSLVCNTSLTTERVVLLFKRENKARNLLLNVDSIDIKTKAPRELKNLSESVCFEFVFKSICISLPEIRTINLSDIFTDEGMKQRKVDIFSNMVLKPWNVEGEIFVIFQRWNLSSHQEPWTCLKIRSQNLVFEINPMYLEFVTSLLSEYRKLYKSFSADTTKPTNYVNTTLENVVVENYKDDLRAGAFQYIKKDVDKFELPSPYEVVFCNRRVQPYMSWRYPQPRCLTKLQIYPVPVEDVNDDYLEEEIRCQLQYYDEIRGAFMPFVSFSLSENSIQTVNLPKPNPNTVAAECWRIILYDGTDSREHVNNLKIDVRSLAGCVRVDSIFQPSLVPQQQILINVTEIQANFSTLIRAEDVAVENYTVRCIPIKQHFLSVICNDLRVYVSNYNNNDNKTIEFSGSFRVNILNYEYLMFQSFVEPVFAECAFYFSQDASPKMAALVKKVGVRVSPNFIHTLSISRDLWNGWKCDSPMPWRVTAPFIICNNTDNSVTFGQEGSGEKVILFPFECYLYAWYDPMLPKSLKITVLMNVTDEYTSTGVQIKKSGCNELVCENQAKNETSHMFVSVIKHSSVVNQVIVYGNLLIYNLTNSEIEMCVVSHGKRDAKFSSTQMMALTTVTRNQLLSIMVLDGHKLSFKVRFSSSQNHWSGLIPLVTFQQSSNQNSWMVKVPLENHKEHFQSLWCQVTREVVNNCPKYLVVFRPLCSVTSFLPWRSEIRIKNDIGSVLSCTSIGDKGSSTELFVPNTVTLDKYTIEWKPNSDYEASVTEVQIQKLPREKMQIEEFSIHSLIEEISRDMDDKKWPFLNIDTSRFTWKTDKINEIKPIIHVFRNEEKGCGTKIEIYPWAIIVNMLSYRVLLDISDTIYTIESYEIVAPPRIESTFKLGIADGKDYLSGTLQLSDDQCFPIPKVTGRIPMNGFVTTMIECDTYVTFINITSKNHKDTRVISMCSSYVISNNSSTDVTCAAVVVCRSGNRSSIICDIPNNLEHMSIHLPAGQNSTVAQPIAKWYKVGKGDVQVLPYLILSIKGNVACPVRICDLSEKQRYSIVFSCRSAEETPIRVFMTAQQNEGQVFLTIWDEKVPQITIHNMSELALNVTSSKSERASAEVSHCSDWNWKFAVAAGSTAYFHIPQQIVENKKKTLQYLKFSVANTKPVKETKWSCGVPLKTCVNQLITLPLSQHHIKLAIFRDSFTYVVWIESATSDELSAKMIRTRLSESFLPIDGTGVSSVTEISTSHTEDSNEIPQKIVNLYKIGTLKPYDVHVLVEQINVTLSCDHETTFEENDVATISLELVAINVSSIRKPNEVKEDIRCCFDVTRYRVDNDQFHRHPFDFSVVLLSDSPATDETATINCNLRDLLVSERNDYSAMKIVVVLDSDCSSNFNIRDLEVVLHSQDVFLEDKFMSGFRSVFENIFSATFDSSVLRSRWLNESAMKCTGVTVKPTETHANASKDAKTNEFSSNKPKSSSSKSVNVSENYTDDKSYNSLVVSECSVQNVPDNTQYVVTADCTSDETECEVMARNYNEISNFTPVPANVMALSRRIAKPLRLRSFGISSFYATVSLHTSTTFYIALDRSPLNFSQFSKVYLITTPFELGNLLMLHYFFGAVYGTGWAISSLEFVGSPGVLARTLGTGIKDFVSMPIYGIASGPRGFVLGVAHGSASLMKHVMAGTLSSVTKFAGSWARTIDRFTLDPDDLLQSEEIRRFPPSNITEGVLQGLSEFGISVLGGISGLAHHPLQYAVSSTGNRSLINSISLGIVGVLTRPLSGAAELVARTGQGILSHVGWNTVPMIRNEPATERNFSHLQISSLKYNWPCNRDYVLIAVEAVNAKNLTIPLCITLTSKYLYITEMTNNGRTATYDIHIHEFKDCDADPTIIRILKPKLHLKNAEDFRKARIVKFITETNHYCNIENAYAKENSSYCSQTETMISFYVNPHVKNFLLTMISFIKNVSQ